jgi:hypothetical protein
MRQKIAQVGAIWGTLGSRKQVVKCRDFMGANPARF